MKKLFTMIAALVLVAGTAFAQDEHPTHYGRIYAHASVGGEIYLPVVEYWDNGQMKDMTAPDESAWMKNQVRYITCWTTGEIYEDSPRLMLFVKPEIGYKFVGITDASGVSMGWMKHWNADNLFYYDWSDMTSTYNPGVNSEFPIELELYVHFAKVDEFGNSVTHMVHFMAPNNGSYKAEGSSVVTPTAETAVAQVAENAVALTATPALGYEFIGWCHQRAIYTPAHYDPVEGENVEESFVIDPSSEPEYFSYQQEAKVYITQDEVVYPVFHAINADEPLFAVGHRVFNTLAAATAYAATAGESKIILVGSGSLSGANTLPAGRTLVIPNDSKLIGYTFWAAYAQENVYGKPYRTLTLAEGATLTVHGTLCVSGLQSSVSCEGGAGATSTVSGDYGLLVLEEGSKLVLDNGSKAYVYGYISGEGSVDALSGSTIFEDFQIMDWRGGTYLLNSVQAELKKYQNNLLLFAQAASMLQAGMATWDEVMASLTYPTKGFEMLNIGTNDNPNYVPVPKPASADMVFPLNQYYIQNVESKITFYPGAVEMVSATINAMGMDIHFDPFAFIGEDEGLFQMQPGSVITKWYDCDRDKQMYEVYGNASIENVHLSSDFISYAFNLVNAPFDGLLSELYILPIAHNMDITVKAGSTTKTTAGICLLPGAQLTVEQGATLQVALTATIYVYDAADWNGHNFAGKGDFMPLEYTSCGGLYADRTDMPATLEDATVAINGTLEIQQGSIDWATIQENTDPSLLAQLEPIVIMMEGSLDNYGQTVNGGVYTTDGGANICSPEGTGSIVQEGPCGEAASVSHSQGNNGAAATEIPVNPAQLHNEDGSYANTVCGGDTAYIYNPETGKWVADTIQINVIKGFNKSLQVESLNGTIWVGFAGAGMTNIEAFSASFLANTTESFSLPLDWASQARLGYGYMEIPVNYTIAATNTTYSATLQLSASPAGQTPTTAEAIISVEMEQKTPTSISDIVSAGLTATADGNSLTIAVSEPQVVTVYDVAGMTCFRGYISTSASLTLATGVYMVHGANELVKCVVE